LKTQFNPFPKNRNKLLAEQFDLVIQSGSLVTPGGVAEGDVGVRDGALQDDSLGQPIKFYDTLLAGA
jgi:hypothetical protein